MKIENLETAPKAEVVVAAPISKPSTVFVTAKDGRKFGLRKLKPSDRFLLSKKIEMPNLSTLMQAISAATVFSIGDEAFEPVASEKDLLRRLDEIGDDGLEAITPVCMEMYGTQMSAAEVETAKN